MTKHAAPLRLGLIGCGKIADAHVSAIIACSRAARLVAVCSASAEHAAQRAHDVGIGQDNAYTDYRCVLERRDVDAIVILLPHHLHFKTCVDALRAGKHVLIEKPLANSMRDCVRMVRAAKVASRVLMVAQVLRYMERNRAVRTSIGKIGAVRMARMEINQNLECYVKPPHWLYDGAKAGGGILMSVGIHKIDLLRYWLGDIEEVHAYGQTASTSFIDAEDYLVCNLKFRSGTLASMSMTYSQFARVPEHFAIFGDQGVIHDLPQDGKAGVWMCSDRPKRTERKFVLVEPGNVKDPFQQQILHFSECVQSKRVPLSDGRDNLGTMAAVFAAYESMKRGGPVKVRVPRFGS